jgi:hypothetical protein
MPQLKHLLPTFLMGRVTQGAYTKWLQTKAAAHARRDQRRFPDNHTSGAFYRQAIHQAVIACGGRDFYTGEELCWELLSKYKNEESKLGKHAYKAGFALLPTVDHAVADDPKTAFRICAWRTNDSKHDLTESEFLALCRRVVAHLGPPQATPNLSEAKTASTPNLGVSDDYR